MRTKKYRKNMENFLTNPSQKIAQIIYRLNKFAKLAELSIMVKSTKMAKNKAKELA
jgi:hypothetical protein